MTPLAGPRGRRLIVLVFAVELASLACSVATRTRVLTTIFDGVPAPGSVPEQPRRATPVAAAAPAVATATPPVAAPAVIPAAPLEALKTWEDVLKALPIDDGGGVDWAEAFRSGLTIPRLVRVPNAQATQPRTLDALMDAATDDPRQPALDLTVRIKPSANRTFEAGEFYEVTFPHSSHTAWLGCSSCHPGILKEKTTMLGILEGSSCGRCHGRVSFNPQTSCARCHANLARPTPETVETEVAAARREPVAANAEVLGRGAAVYRQLCAICHGEAGDGKGPLSGPLNPKPRDFTAGKYKFRTTMPSSIPTDVDIFKTITRGVPGTSMPAFATLPREDRWALTHYVKSLSDRFAKSEPKPIPTSPAPAVTQSVLDMGKGLYKEAGCDTCHGENGGGDGPSAPSLKDDWGFPLRPFNFSSGRPMKGGSGREAIYVTVMTGLQGTPMPGFGDALEPEQGWALASFVQAFFDTNKQPFAVKGDIPLQGAKRVADSPDAKNYPPVVFPHWLHRIRVKCASCHERVFEMRAGANAITMDAIRAGRFCGSCHDGKVAWAIGFTTCIKCHVTPTPAS